MAVTGNQTTKVKHQCRCIAHVQVAVDGQCSGIVYSDIIIRAENTVVEDVAIDSAAASDLTGIFVGHAYSSYIQRRTRPNIYLTIITEARTSYDAS